MSMVKKARDIQTGDKIRGFRVESTREIADDRIRLTAGGGTLVLTLPLDADVDVD